MKIVVDLMGGDNAPKEIILGCVEALGAEGGFELVLVGEQSKVEKELTKHSFDPKRVELVHSTEAITNEDIPTQAIKAKKNSSLVLGLERLMSDQECAAVISAGSTGALLTGATLKIGRIDGVLRPALAPVLPTIKNTGVILIDCGANVDCKPQMLLHFAIMGSAYVSSLFDLPGPSRVGLLNNGAEEGKGNQLTKEAYELLKECKSINFLGNVEGRDILSGDYDVIVTDGFTGNIALKTCEGTANTLMSMMKRTVLTGGLREKLGGLLLKKSLKAMAKTMDYNESGGALFCGVRKIVIKVHGSAKAASVKGAILQAHALHKSRLIERIALSIPKEANV
jgi:glycerol-3-phosphate acyltransferase PlsX